MVGARHAGQAVQGGAIATLAMRDRARVAVPERQLSEI